jgi:hypothetical protein
MSNELTTRGEETALVSEAGFEADGPNGFEGVDADCVTIPFLKLAQPSTDEAKKGSQKYIPGLEQGMFFCPATRKVYGDNVKLIIIRFYRQYVIYSSKEIDADYVGTMLPEQFDAEIAPNATRERSFYLDRKGFRYVDTRNFIVMVAGRISDGPMLMSMSSTGIAPSKKWITMAQNVRDPKNRIAPIWASVWNLNTAYFDNPQGGYYQVSIIDRLGWIHESARGVVKAAFDDAHRIDSSAISVTEERNVTEEAVASTGQEAKDDVETVREVFGKPKAQVVEGQPEIF